MRDEVEHTHTGYIRPDTRYEVNLSHCSGAVSSHGFSSIDLVRFCFEYLLNFATNSHIFRTVCNLQTGELADNMSCKFYSAAVCA